MQGAQWFSVLGVVVSILAGVGVLAGFVVLGAQRGRVESLEKRNDDLEKEIADKDRRAEDARKDLRTANEKIERLEKDMEKQTLANLRLQGEVDTMRSVIEGVTGPIRTLSDEMRTDHELLKAHHREAMSGLDFVYALQVDALRLLGDRRSPAAIKAHLKAKDASEALGHAEGDGDVPTDP